jgi:predicted aspartyl protease
MKTILVLTALMSLGSLGVEPEAVQPPHVSEPSQNSAETLSYDTDSTQRMTVSVNVAGRGPYPFIVDTGAERTVIARQLADALDLPDRGGIMVATVTDLRRVSSVHISQMQVGRRTLNDIHAPAFDQHDLGAMGMLGVDTLRSQRVVFDFARRELTLSTSHIEQEQWPEETIVIRGRSRLGRLVLTDATIEGQRVRVIIDTGSQITIGNNALRRRLAAQRRLGEVGMTQLVAVTGDRLTAEYAIARRIRLGGIYITDMPIAFADVQLFEYLGLDRRPAILLGMDALSLFERVSIDFANRRVRFLPTESFRQQSELRYAALGFQPVR